MTKKASSKQLKIPVFVIKMPDHEDPAEKLCLTQPKQAKNIVISYENEQTHQQKEDDHVQRIFKFLIGFLLCDRLISDENDPSPVERRYRQEIDDARRSETDPVQQRQEPWLAAVEGSCRCR